MLMDESFQMNLLQQSCFAWPSLYPPHHPCKSLLRQLGIYIFRGVFNAISKEELINSQL